MAYEGTVVIDTKVDTVAFKRDIDKMVSIVKDADIFEPLEKSLDRITEKLKSFNGQTNGFSNLSRIAKTASSDASSAADDAIKVTSKISTVAGQVGGVLGGISKLATAGSALATGLGAAASVLSILSAGVALLGTAIIPLGAYIYENMQKPFSEANESLGNMGNSMVAFHEKLLNAKPDLSAFAAFFMQLEAAQSETELLLAGTQGRMTNMLRQEIEERDGLTQDEIRILQGYYDEIAKLNKYDIDVSQYQIVEANKAMFEDLANLTDAEYQNLFASHSVNMQAIHDEIMTNLDDNKNAELQANISWFMRLDNVQKEYHREEFESNIAEINKRYEAEAAETKEGIALVHTAMASGFADKLVQNTTLNTVLDSTLDEMERLTTEYTLAYDAKQEFIDLYNDNHSHDTATHLEGEQLVITGLYEENIVTQWEAFIEGLSATEEESIAIMMQMALETKAAGGQLSNENQKTVDKILDIWNLLPKDAKGEMDEALKGILDSIQAKSPEIFNKLGATGGTALDTLTSILASNGAVGAIEDTAEAIELATDATGKSAEELEEIFSSLFDSSSLSMEDLAAKWGVTVDEINNWMTANNGDMQAWDAMMNEHIDNVANGFSGLAESVGISMQEYIDNVTEKQLAGFTFNNNIMKLADAGVDGNILQNLIERGDYGSAQNWVDELSGLSGEELINRVNEFNGGEFVGLDLIKYNEIRDKLIALYNGNGNDWELAFDDFFGTTLGAKIKKAYDENGEDIQAAMVTAIAETYGISEELVRQKLGENGFDVDAAMKDYITETYGEFGPGIIEQLEASDGNIEEAIARFIYATFGESTGREIIYDILGKGSTLAEAFKGGLFENLPLTEEEKAEAKRQLELALEQAGLMGGLGTFILPTLPSVTEETGEAGTTGETETNSIIQEYAELGTQSAEAFETSLEKGMSEMDMNAIANTLITNVENNPEAFTSVGELLAEQVMLGLTEGITGVAEGAGASNNTGENAEVEAGAVGVVNTMLDDMKTALENKEKLDDLNLAAEGVADSIVDGLETMIDGGTEKTFGEDGELTSGGVGAINNLMNGMLLAMQTKASLLYTEAKTIAQTICNEFCSCWQIESPSKVSYGIMGYFMDGIGNAVSDKSGGIYNQVEDFANRTTLALSELSPEIHSLTLGSQFPEVGLVPAFAGVGAASGGMGAPQYTTTLNQTITSPKPLSPAEMTRQAQDLLRRGRWQLP